MGATTDLREHLGDDSVKVRFGNGRKYITRNGMTVELDANATNEQVAEALNVPKAEEPSATPIPPVSINHPPIVAQTRAVQRLNVTGAGFVGTSFKTKMQALKDELNKLPADLDAALTKMSGAAKVGRNLVESVNAEADDLLATFGQFSNEQE